MMLDKLPGFFIRNLQECSTSFNSPNREESVLSKENQFAYSVNILREIQFPHWNRNFFIEVGEIA